MFQHLPDTAAFQTNRLNEKIKIHYSHLDSCFSL